MNVENHPAVVESAKKTEDMKFALKQKARSMRRAAPKAKELIAKWLDAEQLVVCTDHDLLRCKCAAEAIANVGGDEGLRHYVEVVKPIAEANSAKAKALVEELRPQIAALGA